MQVYTYSEAGQKACYSSWTGWKYRKGIDSKERRKNFRINSGKDRFFTFRCPFN